MRGILCMKYQPQILSQQNDCIFFALGSVTRVLFLSTPGDVDQGLDLSTSTEHPQRIGTSSEWAGNSQPKKFLDCMLRSKVSLSRKLLQSHHDLRGSYTACYLRIAEPTHVTRYWQRLGAVITAVCWTVVTSS